MPHYALDCLRRSQWTIVDSTIYMFVRNAEIEIISFNVLVGLVMKSFSREVSMEF